MAGFTTAGILTGISAGATIASSASSFSAARDNRKQGKKAAAQERLATAERVRRLGVERDAILGAQIAGAAESNVDVTSGSVRSLQAETVSEFERQIEFTNKAGAYAASAAETAGKSAAYQNIAGGLSSLLSAVQIINRDILK